LRVLLVEDDLLLGDGIREGLKQEGYTVDWVTDGQAAGGALAVEPFDLMVLDLNLPYRSGLDVLRELRSGGNTMPVLILTARDTVAERVQGLDVGADDYLTKPFALHELCARARALVRRSKGRADPRLVHGELVLDPAAHTVTQAGQLIDLSSGEFTLLELLLEEAGRVLSRNRLEQALYGWTKDVDSNALEVYVHHLRKKLGRDLIRTVRGVGYVIDRAR
jgi:two-component system response regulator QseB